MTRLTTLEPLLRACGLFGKQLRMDKKKTAIFCLSIFFVFLFLVFIHFYLVFF